MMALFENSEFPEQRTGAGVAQSSSEAAHI